MRYNFQNSKLEEKIILKTMIFAAIITMHSSLTSANSTQTLEGILRIFIEQVNLLKLHLIILSSSILWNVVLQHHASFSPALAFQLFCFKLHAFLALVLVRYAERTCNIQAGHAVGGTNEDIGYEDSPEICFWSVKNKRNDANGMTWESWSRKCYAEFKALQISPTCSLCQSCIFKGLSLLLCFNNYSIFIYLHWFNEKIFH